MDSQKRQYPYEDLSKRANEILRLLADGLSDREIAERLIMTINTVKWYNRQIYSILGVGSRTQAIACARELQLLHEDTETVPSLSVARHSPPHNLPVETTHFIGRTSAIASSKQLLDTTRLLTLVGPPGTGKTRLALRLAWDLVDTFRDGIYFVPLAPLSDPALIMAAIAGIIGVNESRGRSITATLKHVLRDSQMLLVLDNFEHLLSGATQVSDLLSASPSLRVLTTSREPLHLYGEQEYAVPPLQLPDPTYSDLHTLTACESIALFLQQARAVRSDFELTSENVSDISAICVRLEGLPLAIELAAARIKLLPPQTLLVRLSSRLDTLIGGPQDLPTRQQTLRNTIEWSYNLLDEGEKILFARLAVFRGGFSLEAIDAICGSDLSIDVFEGLESLVNKSLIQRKEEQGGVPRFGMLETLHEYARERLAVSGEVATINRRYADYFVELAERAAPELRLAQQQQWFSVLETDYENMRAVLKWSLGEGDIQIGIRLAGALHLFWFAYGYHAEGRRWTTLLLEELDSVPMVYHVPLLLSAGHMAFLYDLDTAILFFTSMLQISRDLEDELNMAWAFTFLGYAMMRETDAAIAMAQEGLLLFRQLNHKPGIAQSLNIIGEIFHFGGDNARAQDAYEECLAVSQETGEIRRIRFMVGNLAFIARHQQDYQRAIALAEQGLHLALALNNRLDIADAMATLAGVIGVTGHPEHAARLLSVWEATLARMGATPQPSDQPDHERSIEAVRGQLDPTTFELMWQQGRTLSLEQAVASIVNDGE